MTESVPAQTLPPCELCGGSQIGGLSVMAEHSIGIYALRSVFSRRLAPLSAVVCLRCGHTKLFAQGLDNLHTEVEKHPDWFTR